MLFDIVIPVGPNDKDIITKQINYTKNIKARNIYLIVNGCLDIEGCISIQENIFPFSLETVSRFHGKLERNGWYLQQLLKLYAGMVIPGILERYLVIDADTFFLKSINFIEDDKCLYSWGTEYHKPYFLHISKLYPELTKIKNISGICHHMMFETKYIKELFNIIENKHNDAFYNVFLKNVIDYEGSGASEYELYFNYMLFKHPDDIILRPLNWINTDKMIYDGYDYISYHWHMR